MKVLQFTLLFLLNLNECAIEKGNTHIFDVLYWPEYKMFL